MNILSAKRFRQFPTIKTLTTQALSATVLVTIGITAWQLNQKYNLSDPLLSLPFFIGTALAILYRVVNPIGWALIIKGMGHSVSTISASKIWLMSESRRWLPGGVWGYASRAVASAELGVFKTAASASMAIELLVTIVAAIIVSLAGVAWHYTELATAFESLLQKYEIEVVHVVIASGLAILTLTVLVAARRPIMKKIENAKQKFSALQGVELNGRILGHSLLYMISMAALNGTVNSALLPAIDSTYVPIGAMIAATAIAWTIGFLAIFSPGGILVREAALATILLPWLPWESGFSLAILSRFAQIIAEVVGMLLVMGLKLRSSKTAPINCR